MIAAEKRNEPPTRTTDCYSEGERNAMEWTQRIRGTALAPVLKILATLKVSPDHLTLISLVSGLSFCVIWFWSVPAALAALLIHALLDGLDGPLARHLNLASPRGSFTDTIADQTVIAATTITLMVDSVIDTAAGGVYLSAYTVVVAMAMVRNAMDIPYTLLIRPRFLVYSWILVEIYLLPGTINGLLWLINILLLWKLFTGFVNLRRHL